jgi:hypothetical protein
MLRPLWQREDSDPAVSSFVPVVRGLMKLSNAQAQEASENRHFGNVFGSFSFRSPR